MQPDEEGRDRGRKKEAEKQREGRKMACADVWIWGCKETHTTHFRKLYVQPCLFLSDLKYLHCLPNSIQMVLKLFGIVLASANSSEPWLQQVAKNLDNSSCSHCLNEVNKTSEPRFRETLLPLKLKLVSANSVHRTLDPGDVNQFSGGMRLFNPFHLKSYVSIKARFIHMTLHARNIYAKFPKRFVQSTSSG